MSLVLPWIAAVLAIVGLYRLGRGDPVGGWLLVIAAVCLAADLVFDVAWSRPSRLPSDQPDLNRRGAQHVGELVVVVEPLIGGRGRVRVRDGIWQAEGPDLPAGAKARVTGVRGTVLTVEGAED